MIVYYDIIFIPSVRPETFSHTTSEAISMNVPVACFNIGAQANKIKNYEKGLILSSFDAQTAINEIYNFVSQYKA